MSSQPQPLPTTESNTIPAAHRARPPSKVIWQRTFNFIFLVAMFIVNGMAAVGVINGQTTGAVSRNNFTYVTPASYAFSIWSVIYFFLACWGVYQLVPKTYGSRPINEAIGNVFMLSAVFNLGWIVAWQYEVLWLSVVLIVLLLVSLAVIYVRLSRSFVPAASWIEYVFVHLPFSLYLAWVTAAALINAFVLSTTFGQTADITPSIIGIVIIGLLELGISITRMDPVISAVGCWALAAIAVNYRASVASIFTTALIMAVLCGITSLLVLVYNTVAIIRGRRIPWTQKLTSSQSFSTN